MPNNAVESAHLEVTTNADEYAGQVKKIEGATRGMGANLGRSALEASRAIEDLQYGIGGVVNNIPGLVSALGGGAGAMAAFSLGAVAIAQVAKQWDNLKASFETRTTIPQAADDVTGLQKELEKARDRMKELGEKSTVTLAQLAEYNALRTKTATIEKSIADQQDRQARLQRVAKLENPDSVAAAKERKEGLAGLGGQQDELAAGVAASLNAENDLKRQILEGVLKRATERANSTIGEEQKFFLEQVRSTMADIKAIPTAKDRLGEAKDIVANALDGGKLDDFRKLERHTIDRPDLFTDDQRSTIRDASPEVRAEMARIDDEDAEFERRNENAKQARLKRQERDKKIQQEREQAGRLAEQDPEAKAEQERLNKIFGGFGREGVDASQAIENAQRARQKDVEKARKGDAADLSPMAVEAAQETQQIMAENLGISRQMANQIQRINAENRRLAAEADELRQFVAQPGPIRLPGGR